MYHFFPTPALFSRAGSRLFAVSVLITFTLTSIIQPGTSYAATPIGLDAVSISVPHELGVVHDSFMPDNAQHPMVIHVQDAHANVEVQKNVCGLMKTLQKNNGVDTLLLEGATGDLDVSFYRAFPLEQTKKKLVTEFLEESSINGAEACAITAEKPFHLFGIDNESLYLENIQMYLKTREFSARVKQYAETLNQGIENRRRAVYNEALHSLIDAGAQFDNHEGNGIEYVRLLIELARSETVSLFSYRALGAIADIEQYHTRIDVSALSRETERLISGDLLSAGLSDAEMRTLALMEMDYKAGRIDAFDFYSYLRRLCVEHSIDFRIYQNCNLYVNYLGVAKHIDADTLTRDRVRLEKKLIKKLIRTDAEKQLYFFEKTAAVLVRILSLKATPDDIAYFRTYRHSFNEDVFTQSLVECGISCDVPTFSLNTFYPVLERFYALAEAREDTFIEASLEALEKTHSDRAILFAGGYHTTGITQRLKAKNIPYVVIAPRIVDVTAHTDTYDTLMRSFAKSFGVQEGERGGTVMVPSQVFPPRTITVDADGFATPLEKICARKMSRELFDVERLKNLRNTQYMEINDYDQSIDYFKLWNRQVKKWAIMQYEKKDGSRGAFFIKVNRLIALLKDSNRSMEEIGLVLAHYGINITEKDQILNETVVDAPAADYTVARERLQSLESSFSLCGIQKNTDEVMPALVEPMEAADVDVNAVSFFLTEKGLCAVSPRDEYKDQFFVFYSRNADSDVIRVPAEKMAEKRAMLREVMDTILYRYPTDVAPGLSHEQPMYAITESLKRDLFSANAEKKMQALFREKEEQAKVKYKELYDLLAALEDPTTGLQKLVLTKELIDKWDLLKLVKIINDLAPKATAGIRAMNNIRTAADLTEKMNALLTLLTANELAEMALEQAAEQGDKEVHTIVAGEVRYNTIQMSAMLRRRFAAMGIHVHSPEEGDFIPIGASSFVTTLQRMHFSIYSTASHAARYVFASKLMGMLPAPISRFARTLMGKIDKKKLESFQKHRSEGAQLLIEDMLKLARGIEKKIQHVVETGEPLVIDFARADDSLIQYDIDSVDHPNGIPVSAQYADYLKGSYLNDAMRERMSRSLNNGLKIGYEQCNGASYNFNQRVFGNLLGDDIVKKIEWQNIHPDSFFDGKGLSRYNKKSQKEPKNAEATKRVTTYVEKQLSKIAYFMADKETGYSFTGKVSDKDLERFAGLAATDAPEYEYIHFEIFTQDEKKTFLNGQGMPYCELPDGRVLAYYRYDPVAPEADLSQDVSILEVVVNSGMPAFMRERPVGYINKTTDPDGDRFVVMQVEKNDEKTKERLKRLNVAYLTLSDDKILVVYVPNQNFLQIQCSLLNTLRARGEFRQDREDFDEYNDVTFFGITTTVSTSTWRDFWKKNKVPTVCVPVGFKEIARMQRIVEYQIMMNEARVEAGLKKMRVVVHDVFGNPIDLGYNPRLLFAGEESGGMVVGATELLESTDGVRQFLSWREKNAVEASLLMLGMVSQMFEKAADKAGLNPDAVSSDELYANETFLEHMSLSRMLEDIFVEVKAENTAELRTDLVLLDPMVAKSMKSADERKAYEDAAEDRRNGNDAFFVGLAFAKEDGVISLNQVKEFLIDAIEHDTEIIKTLVDATKNENALADIKEFIADQVDECYFQGDGVYFPLKSGGYFAVRPSGTDPKNKGYPSTTDAYTSSLISNAIAGLDPVAFPPQAFAKYLAEHDARQYGDIPAMLARKQSQYEKSLNVDMPVEWSESEAVVARLKDEFDIDVLADDVLVLLGVSTQQDDLVYATDRKVVYASWAFDERMQKEVEDAFDVEDNSEEKEYEFLMSHGLDGTFVKELEGRLRGAYRLARIFRGVIAFITAVGSFLLSYWGGLFAAKMLLLSPLFATIGAVVVAILATGYVAVRMKKRDEQHIAQKDGFLYRQMSEAEEHTFISAYTFRDKPWSYDDINALSSQAYGTKELSGFMMHLVKTITDEIGDAETYAQGLETLLISLTNPVIAPYIAHKVADLYTTAHANATADVVRILSAYYAYLDTPKSHRELVEMHDRVVLLDAGTKSFVSATQLFMRQETDGKVLEELKVLTNLPLFTMRGIDNHGMRQLDLFDVDRYIEYMNHNNGASNTWFVNKQRSIRERLQARGVLSVTVEQLDRVMIRLAEDLKEDIAADRERLRKGKTAQGIFKNVGKFLLTVALLFCVASVFGASGEGVLLQIFDAIPVMTKMLLGISALGVMCAALMMAFQGHKEEWGWHHMLVGSVIAGCGVAVLAIASVYVAISPIIVPIFFAAVVVGTIWHAVYPWQVGFISSSDRLLTNEFVRDNTKKKIARIEQGVRTLVQPKKADGVQVRSPEGMGGTIIGVDIGGTSIEVSLVGQDENGDFSIVRDSKKLATKDARGLPKDFLRVVSEFIDGARVEWASREFTVLPFIGVGSPGRFISPNERGFTKWMKKARAFLLRRELRKDLVIAPGSAANLGRDADTHPGDFDGVNLEKELTERLGGVVHVNNDAVAQMMFAYQNIMQSHPDLAKKISGKKFAYIGPGTGLGGGFYDNGVYTDGHIYDLRIIDEPIMQTFHWQGEALEIALFEKAEFLFSGGNAIAFLMMKINDAAAAKGLGKPFAYPADCEGDEKKIFDVFKENGGANLNAILSEGADNPLYQLAFEIATFEGAMLAKIVDHIHRGDVRKWDSAADWPEADKDAVKGTEVFLLGGSATKGVFGQIVKSSAETALQEMGLDTVELILPKMDTNRAGVLGAAGFVSDEAKAMADIEKTRQMIRDSKTIARRVAQRLKNRGFWTVLLLFVATNIFARTGAGFAVSHNVHPLVFVTYLCFLGALSAVFFIASLMELDETANRNYSLVAASAFVSLVSAGVLFFLGAPVWMALAVTLASVVSVLVVYGIVTLARNMISKKDYHQKRKKIIENVLMPSTSITRKRFPLVRHWTTEREEGLLREILYYRMFVSNLEEMFPVFEEKNDLCHDISMGYKKISEGVTKYILYLEGIGAGRNREDMKWVVERVEKIASLYSELATDYDTLDAEGRDVLYERIMDISEINRTMLTEAFFPEKVTTYQAVLQRVAVFFMSVPWMPKFIREIEKFFHIRQNGMSEENAKRVRDGEVTELVAKPDVVIDSVERYQDLEAKELYVTLGDLIVAALTKGDEAAVKEVVVALEAWLGRTNLKRTEKEKLVRSVRQTLDSRIQLGLDTLRGASDKRINTVRFMIKRCLEVLKPEQYFVNGRERMFLRAA